MFTTTILKPVAQAIYYIHMESSPIMHAHVLNVQYHVAP